MVLIVEQPNKKEIRVRDENSQSTAAVSADGIQLSVGAVRVPSPLSTSG